MARIWRHFLCSDEVREEDEMTEINAEGPLGEKAPVVNSPIHNVPDYSDAVAEKALRDIGDQGYADMNAAMERKTKPQAEDFRERIHLPAEVREDIVERDTD
jgi:hypothetical protein